MDRYILTLEWKGRLEISLRIPNKGVYSLKICGYEKEDTKLHDENFDEEEMIDERKKRIINIPNILNYRLLVDNESNFIQTTTFPRVYNSFAGEGFYSEYFKVLPTEWVANFIQTRYNEPLELSFSHDPNCDLYCEIHANDVRADGFIQKVNTTIKTDSLLTSFSFHAKYNGEYAFNLFACKKNGQDRILHHVYSKLILVTEEKRLSINDSQSPDTSFSYGIYEYLNDTRKDSVHLECNEHSYISIQRNASFHLWTNDNVKFHGMEAVISLPLPGDYVICMYNVCEHVICCTKIYYITKLQLTVSFLSLYNKRLKKKNNQVI